MRVMVLVKASAKTEAGEMPTTELLEEMGRYNEELVKAGVMQSGEGLHPTSRGARVRFSGYDRRVVEGPFPLGDGLIAGFWMWEVPTLEDAIAWAKRCPNPTGAESELELRPVFEIEDFGDAATPEVVEAEQRMREELTARAAAKDER